MTKMIGRDFRHHPEWEPSGKISIFGRALCSAERMSAYASRRNPAAPDVAQLYLEQGERFGIRGDVAYCQAMLDTKVWTEDPEGPPRKPFAYAIWGGLAEPWTEPDLVRRTERHLERLFEIASRKEEVRGMCWEDLNGIWAIPGSLYGQDVAAVWRGMLEWGKDGGNKQDTPAAADGGGPIVTGDEPRKIPAAEEDLSWLADRIWLPAPSPHPDRKVTWAELARVLRTREGES